MIRAGRLTYIAIAVAAQQIAASGAVPVRQTIHSPEYRTLLVYPENRRYEAPVIHGTGSDERITVSFDLMGDERRYLRYELIHCDENWEPERLTPAELTRGFNEGQIEDAEYSRGTVSRYVNYRLQIPNEDVSPLLSGNWTVRVYEEDRPETTVLEARFMIAEDAVDITGQTSGRTDIDTNAGHQQLEVTVDTHGSGVRDIAGDMRLVISQNGRSDNCVMVSTPLRMEGSKAVYAHDSDLIFDGGNEYRRFESVSLTYRGLHVAAIGTTTEGEERESSEGEETYVVELEPDRPRAESGYEYDSTQQGRYTIAAEDTDNPDSEGEYALTLFALEMDEVDGGSVYVEGDLTGRRLDESSRMIYNRESGRYELGLRLKQGSYNYQYVTVGPGDTMGKTKMTEGDSYRTLNEYGIAVYYRRQGDRYTRLLGYGVIRN